MHPDPAVQAPAQSKPIPLATLVFYGAVLVLLATLALNYAGFLGYLLSDSGTLLWKAYDWPDTAVMVRSIMDGRFFSGYPEAFISGGSMFGLFPPLLPLLAGILDLAVGDITATFVLLSAVLSILITYLLAKDWPDWPQKLTVVLLLFFYPLVGDIPPFVVRLRELLAVFLLVLLFKNPLRLGPEKNYLVLGLLLILTQPVVALMGLLSYPFLNSDGWKPKPGLRSFAIALALVLVFSVTYHEHIILKLPGNAAGTNSLGLLPWAYGLSAGGMLLLLGIPLLFFFVFSRDNIIRGLLLLFGLWWFSLIAVSGTPALLSLLAFPIKDDFLFQTLPFFAFFALFPPPGKPEGGNVKLFMCVLLVLALICANAKLGASHDALGSKDAQFRAITAALENHTKLLSMSFYAVESQRTFFFSGVDFRLLSEIFLRGLGVQAYYSPFQQIYDTDGFYAPVSGLMDAIDEKNISACAPLAANLSARTDYLHLHLDMIHDGDPGWSGGILAGLTDRDFLGSCGISLVRAVPENGTGTVQLLYRFNAAGG